MEPMASAKRASQGVGTNAARTDAVGKGNSRAAAAPGAASNSTCSNTALAQGSKAGTGHKSDAKKRKLSSTTFTVADDPSALTTHHEKQFEEARAREGRYSLPAPTPPPMLAAKETREVCLGTAPTAFAAAAAATAMTAATYTGAAAIKGKPRRPWEWSPQDCKAVAQRAMAYAAAGGAAGGAYAGGVDVGGLWVTMAAEPVVLFDSDEDNWGDIAKRQQEEKQSTVSQTRDSKSGEAQPSFRRGRGGARSRADGPSHSGERQILCTGSKVMRRERQDVPVAGRSEAAASDGNSVNAATAIRDDPKSRREEKEAAPTARSSRRASSATRGQKRQQKVSCRRGKVSNTSSSASSDAAPGSAVPPASEVDVEVIIEDERKAKELSAALNRNIRRGIASPAMKPGAIRPGASADSSSTRRVSGAVDDDGGCGDSEDRSECQINRRSESRSPPAPSPRQPSCLGVRGGVPSTQTASVARQQPATTSRSKGGGKRPILGKKKGNDSASPVSDKRETSGSRTPASGKKSSSDAAPPAIAAAKVGAIEAEVHPWTDSGLYFGLGTTAEVLWEDGRWYRCCVASVSAGGKSGVLEFLPYKRVTRVREYSTQLDLEKWISDGRITLPETNLTWD